MHGGVGRMGSHLTSCSSDYRMHGLAMEPLGLISRKPHLAGSIDPNWGTRARRHNQSQWIYSGGMNRAANPNRQGISVAPTKGGQARRLGGHSKARPSSLADTRAGIWRLVQRST